MSRRALLAGVLIFAPASVQIEARVAQSTRHFPTLQVESPIMQASSTAVLQLPWPARITSLHAARMLHGCAPTTVAGAYYLASCSKNSRHAEFAKWDGRLIFPSGRIYLAGRPTPKVQRVIRMD